MELDIYMLDANVFDNGINCHLISIPDRKSPYGDLSSPWFRKAYPNGFEKIYTKANSFGTRLGLWIGPDGYGNNISTARARVDLLVNLCRDFKMRLFKLDGCSSGMNPSNEKYFIEAMQGARKYSPDLIVLNHRIPFGEEALKQTTTFLWEGKETYIDVHIFNDIPAVHHREGNMKRSLPPNLQRLTEDHGVCLSSAMDFWEDDLVLQAFNRNLIMSPEIYGSPWFLKDEEFPLLAGIFNLHKHYNTILAEDSKELPESNYGYKAVSRGNAGTRFISLRNLSWNKATFQLAIDNSIGLTEGEQYYVVQHHPYEKFLGTYKPGSKVAYDVLPFRAGLVKVSSKKDNFMVEGCAYKVIKDVSGKPVEIILLAMPGDKPSVKIDNYQNRFTKATLDGKPANEILSGSVSLQFSGKPLQQDYHRRLGVLVAADVPKDAAFIYETSCFENDNNSLEVRSLYRAGETKFAAVKAARDAFFEDSIFMQNGSWDKFAFDDNVNTSFKNNVSAYTEGKFPTGSLRVDMRSVINPEKIVLQEVPDGYQPGKIEVSTDLRSWQVVPFKRQGHNIIFSPDKPLRYIKAAKAPLAIAEIKAYKNNQPVANLSWKASNLFANTKADSAKFARQFSFTLQEAAKNSYLVLTVPGEYNPENIFAGIRTAKGIIAPADRSPSFLYNNWEYVGFSNGNVSFYFPVTNSMLNKKLEAVLISTNDSLEDISPELWITAYPIPFAEKKLTLE